MRFGSVCSGIEAASVAWEPLGWECAFVSEIDPFACHVLHHRFGATRPISMPQPDADTKPKERKAMLAAIKAVSKLPEAGRLINYGDFQTIQADAGPIDVLVGGSPCQSFSIAGLRGGMADDRGNLALEFLRLADRLRPRWVVFENVAGLLSSEGGRDFGAFLGGLAELGYGFSYRVLDAEYVRTHGFGRAVPQRRRRVFVVGHPDWRRAASVLFERECLSGNPPPSRQAGPGDTATASHRAGVGVGVDLRNSVLTGDVAMTVQAGPHPPDPGGVPHCMDVSHTLHGHGFDASEHGTGRGMPAVPPAMGIQMNFIRETRIRPYAGTLSAQPGNAQFNGVIQPVPIQNATRGKDQNGLGIGSAGDPMYTLDNASQHAIAFQERGREGGRTLGWQEDPSYALRAIDGGGCGDWFRVAYRWALRRLTPLECERLQGFPDFWTLVPYRGKLAPDGPRYKCVGNSMAVNCMRWIGSRIDMVEKAVGQS